MSNVDPLNQQVLSGLRAPQKTLPPTLFYDSEGSALFDQITALEEYYPTRVEGEIFSVHGQSIAAAATDGAAAVVLIEPGCGSGAKAASLLCHLPARAYVGIDVSVTALEAGASRLRDQFAGLAVVAVEADYHQPLCLPPLPEGRRVGFFPGSTIGNFDPDGAVAFLGLLAELVGPDGRLVIGVDLWKDPAVLHAAYDDAQGVTAAFNRNALSHLNRRAGANFQPETFVHEARVNEDLRRVEMHLVSRLSQAFVVQGQSFFIEAGESIHTENSYKYDEESFAGLARRAGLRNVAHWTDARRRFAVFLFAVDGQGLGR